MRDIEAAFSATIGQDIELKTSKAGKPFCGFGAVVAMGQDEDGKDVSQWLRVACFGKAAENIASRAKKGDKCRGAISDVICESREATPRSPSMERSR